MGGRGDGGGGRLGRILKILPPKNENFQIKNSDIFHIFAQKHRLWLLVRTALWRRF